MSFLSTVACEHPILHFFLQGSGNVILIGWIIFIYLKSYVGDIRKEEFVKHSLILSLFLLCSFFLILQDPSYQKWYSLLPSTAAFLIMLYYFKRTSDIIKNELRHILINKAYIRLVALYYLCYILLLQMPFFDVFSKSQGKEIFPSGLQNVVDGLSLGFLAYTCFLFLHFLGYFFFFYALGELHLIRKLIIPREVVSKSIENRELQQLASNIFEYFHTKENFKNQEINLATVIRDLGTSRTQFTNYLKIAGYGTFKDFVNNLRVKKFKQLVSDESYKQFDLVGIAYECGFKSKSTFFRVFKSIEGVTPKEYQIKENCE
ncbi:MAG: AraC family transcriptional regulator [Bacteroidota bacterium]